MLQRELSKKMLNICILNILKEYTDEKHHLYQKEIIEILKRDYGLFCERKAVSRNLNALRDFGYDIQDAKGYYLSKRMFNKQEIELLISGLLVSRHVTNKQCREITEKLQRYAGRYFDFPLSLVVRCQKQYPGIEQFSKVFGVIIKALKLNRKILIRYATATQPAPQKRHASWELVSPQKFVSENGWLYIACREQNEEVKSYRIDKIREVLLTKQTAL